MYRALAWIQGVLIPHLGPFGLFAVAFLDSSFLSVPEINDVLVVGAALREPGTVWLVIALITLGSLTGSCVLWAIGRRGGAALLERRYGPERTARIRDAYRRWGILALAIPAVLPPPMPFKAFVLAAGVFGFPFARLVATLALARGLRYSFWAAMGVVYGDAALATLRAVDHWTGQHLPLVGALAAAAALTVALVWVRRRRAGVHVGGVP